MDTIKGRPPGRPLIHHVGVFASDHAFSRRFYAEALRPLDIVATRPTAPEYKAYRAFIGDPDGNNIEALVKERS